MKVKLQKIDSLVQGARLKKCDSVEDTAPPDTEGVILSEVESRRGFI